MNSQTKTTYIRLALVAFGAIFFLIYPIGKLWPSGWVWHGGEGIYYLQMFAGVYFTLGAFLIAAARNPAAHRSLISFTAVSSGVHGLIMGVQAVMDANEHGHLVGDVPALLLVAVVLWYLMPEKEE